MSVEGRDRRTASEGEGVVIPHVVRGVSQRRVILGVDPVVVARTGQGQVITRSERDEAIGKRDGIAIPRCNGGGVTGGHHGVEVTHDQGVVGTVRRDVGVGEISGQRGVGGDRYDVAGEVRRDSGVVAGGQGRISPQIVSGQRAASRDRVEVACMRERVVERETVARNDGAVLAGIQPGIRDAGIGPKADCAVRSAVFAGIHDARGVTEGHCQVRSRVGGLVVDGGKLSGSDRVVLTGSRTSVGDVQGIRSRDRVVGAGSREGGIVAQRDLIVLFRE